MREQIMSAPFLFRYLFRYALLLFIVGLFFWLLISLMKLQKRWQTDKKRWLLPTSSVLLLITVLVQAYQNRYLNPAVFYPVMAVTSALVLEGVFNFSLTKKSVLMSFAVLAVITWGLFDSINTFTYHIPTSEAEKEYELNLNKQDWVCQADTFYSVLNSTKDVKNCHNFFYDFEENEFRVFVYASDQDQFVDQFSWAKRLLLFRNDPKPIEIKWENLDKYKITKKMPDICFVTHYHDKTYEIQIYSKFDISDQKSINLKDLTESMFRL